MWRRASAAAARRVVSAARRDLPAAPGWPSAALGTPSDAVPSSSRRALPPRRACHDAAALRPFADGMSDADKFLFDTNGFVVVPDVFGAADLRRFHDAIDAHADSIHELSLIHI